MRIRVSHATHYRYDAPVKGVTQLLRLTPRNHDGQHVVNWRIELSVDCRLFHHEDAFGNITHSFTADGPFRELSVAVEGVVETRDTNGVIAGTLERFPAALYLRETPLTQPDEAIRDLAAKMLHEAGGDRLAMLHSLRNFLYREIEFDTNWTHPATTAAEAFALRRGVCQDISHIFIAAARCAGVPARYIGGHLYRTDGVTAQNAGHAWAEAYVEDLGWVGFDPANGVCSTETHVRIAAGLDYLGAAPIRGSRRGGAAETMNVNVYVDQAQRQSQT
jgi:transglutaminase-like putative cysteine protease